MARPRSNLRLFVAIYPPPAVVAEMLEAAAGLDLPPHRMTRPDQVHLTLHFIGDTAVGDLDATVESVARATSGIGAMDVTPTRLITLPRRGSARLVAAEVEAPPALAEIQRRLVTRLARQPRGRPGDRFLPHLTLCRFRAPTRGSTIDEPLAAATFRVVSVQVMRSSLQPEGAVHREVASFGLAEGA